MPRLLLAAGMGLILAGCAGQGPALPSRDGSADHDPAPSAAAKVDMDSASSLGRMSAFIDRIGGQGAVTRKAEIGRLQGLDKPGAVDRFELAYLLSLDNPGAEDLIRAQAHLEGLAPLFPDAAPRQFVRLLQRILALERALQQERKRTDELQDKLRQIKQLELELLRRSQTKPPQGK